MSAAPIAAVLIVRNEATRLAPCLAALAPAVDAIIVADTGSTDDTRTVAGQFTPHVYDFAWCDDFAAARNFAVAQAPADWILSIDADEVLRDPAAAREHLLHFVATHLPQTAGTLELHSPTRTGEVVVDQLVRLFHRAHHRFEGRIHEQVVPLASPLHADATGVVADHSGYLLDMAAAREKAARNTALLEAQLRETPDDEYYWYQLGNARQSIEDSEGAAQAYDRALRAMRFDGAALPEGRLGPVAPAVVAKALCGLAYAWVNIGRPTQAQALLRRHHALAHPATRYADFQHALGYAELQAGAAFSARKAFERALACPAEIVRGTGSYRSRYHLGLLAEAEGEAGAAQAHYEAALAEAPDFAPARARLQALGL